VDSILKISVSTIYIYIFEKRQELQPAGNTGNVEAERNPATARTEPETGGRQLKEKENANSPGQASPAAPTDTKQQQNRVNKTHEATPYQRKNRCQTQQTTGDLMAPTPGDLEGEIEVTEEGQGQKSRDQGMWHAQVQDSKCCPFAKSWRLMES
jgi:hypothetical protein